MGLLAHHGARDRGGDAFAGHVGQFLIHELRRVGAAFAHQAGIEPLLGDALELPEQVELGVFAGIAPLGVDQALGQVEEHAWMRRMSPRCSRLSSTPSPMMPSFFVMDGPTRSGVSSRMESALNLAVRRSSGSSTR